MLEVLISLKSLISIFCKVLHKYEMLNILTISINRRLKTKSKMLLFLFCVTINKTNKCKHIYVSVLYKELIILENTYLKMYFYKIKDFMI
jgi:hypothetical protein